MTYLITIVNGTHHIIIYYIAKGFQFNFSLFLTSKYLWLLVTFDILGESIIVIVLIFISFSLGSIFLVAHFLNILFYLFLHI